MIMMIMDNGENFDDDHIDNFLTRLHQKEHPCQLLMMVMTTMLIVEMNKMIII